MDYSPHILRILAEAGRKGLPLRKIVRHTHYAVNTLFDTVAYTDVYADVSAWLNRQARVAGAPVMRADKRGWYRLNPRFAPKEDDEPAAHKADETRQLTLFDE